MVTMASASAYSPLKRSEVRAFSKSPSRSAAFDETSSCSPWSPSDSASSKSSPRSRAAVVSSFQRVSSSRSPSASRASFRATRWSSQKPGASIAASISARRAAFVTGSKTPRGRLDAAEQVPQGGGVDAHPAPLPSRTAAPTGDSLLALCAMALLVFLPRAAGARVIPANASSRHNRRLWGWG